MSSDQRGVVREGIRGNRTLDNLKQFCEPLVHKTTMPVGALDLLSYFLPLSSI